MVNINIFNSQGINDEFYRKGGAISATLQITNRQFNVEEYLKTVQANTPFDSLRKTISFLDARIKEKKDVQRDLVKQNFDKFIDAKGTIDAVFLEMQSQGLTSGDYGMSRCQDAVQVASQRVKELYAPLLEDQQREMELRKKLAWVNKHRWILESPQRLTELRSLGDWPQLYKYCQELIGQWKKYLERDLPMREQLEKFWEQRVSGELERVIDTLQGILQNKRFSSAAEAQTIMCHFTAFRELILTTTTTTTAAAADKVKALDIYLEAQNNWLVQEINKIAAE